MKHLFSFRQRPNETLTHSTTRGLNGSRMVVETTVKGRSNDCRPTLGRLSTLFLLLFALSFGFNQEAKAYGWTQYVSQDPTTVYVGKKVTFTMWLNGDANGATYKRFGYGTTNSKAGLTWSENYAWKEESGGNNRWEFNFTPTSAGTWYWSLWIGWGYSVGDNGRYYNNNSSWNEGIDGFTSSSITVLAIPQPTNQTATADKNTINLSWSKNTPGHNVMVVRSTSSTAPSPSAGTAYSVGSTIGTGYTVVYNSNGTSYSDKNLSYGTKYYYYFFSEHYSYYSTSVSANATTPSTYTVTYDKNGATSGTVPTDATKYVSGTSVTVKSNSGSLAKTGYTFSGWNTKTDGTGDTYAAGSGTFSITSNTTLYAKWAENLTTVTISSNGNGTVSPASASVGVATTESVSATPADGYHFASWAVTGNADIKSETTDNPVTLYGNGSGSTGTLKATFAETLYTVTIVSGTATSTTAGCVTTGTATAAAAATGKKFDKWELGTGITLVDCAVSDENITFHASQTATVTATYADASKYSLNVVAGAGITAVSGSKTEQTVLPIVSNISATPKTGYSFAQWTKTGEGTVTYTSGSATSANATVSVSVGSVTLTASATPNTNTAYTVKHYKQNLAGTDYDLADTDNLTGTTDASVTPAVKSYEGFTAPSTQTVTIKGDGTTEVIYNYTRNSYTLTWAGLIGATVTGGTAAGSVKYGAALTAPTVTKTGYNFTGWTPSVPETMPAANSTYTAQWTEVLYNVTINSSNEEGATLYYDGAYHEWGSVVQVGLETTKSITVTPNPGYKLNAFSVSNGGRVSGSGTSFTVSAYGANGTVTANPVTTPTIFFDNRGLKWSDVYVHFHPYWDTYNNPSKGAGAKGEHTDRMTQIGTTGIYYFNYTDAQKNAIVAFTQASQSDYNNFHETKVAYREDFNECEPLFIPSTTRSNEFNSCDYFSDKYNVTGNWDTYSTTSKYYLLGLDDWTEKDDRKLTKSDALSSTQTISISLNANTTYDFKFKTCRGTWYGVTAGTIITSANCTNIPFTAGNETSNCSINTTIAGTYTFSFDNNSKKLSVEYPAMPAPESITVTAERYYGEDKISTFIATDPYTVYTDEKIKLTIDEVAAPTGCTTYYQFGDNAASTERTYTISNITTTASSIEAKVFFRPNSGGKDGDATTETINYQGVATPTLHLTASWSEAQEGGDEVPENVTIYYSTSYYNGPATVTRSKDGEYPVTFMTITSGDQAHATYILPDQNVQRQTFVATATANSRTFTATKAVSIYRLVEITITDASHLMDHYYMWENGTNPLHEETAWPGNTFFSTLGNAHIFYVKYPSYTHFVLNDGKQEGAIQTVNVAVPDQSTCYTIGTQITGEEDPDKGKYAVEEAAQCPNKLYVGDIDDVSAVQGEGVIVSPQVDIDPLLNENDLTISFNYGSTQGITCDQRGRSFMVTATAGTDTYHISVTYSIPGADPITKPVTIKVTSAIMIQAKYGNLGWSDHNEIYIHYWGNGISEGWQKMTWKDYVGEESNKQDRVYARIPLGNDNKINFQIYAWNMNENWHVTEDVIGVTQSGCYTIGVGSGKRSINREADNCWTAYYVEIDMANGTVYRSNTVEDLTQPVSFFAPSSSAKTEKSGLVRIICNGSQTAVVPAATFTESGIYTAKITANGAGLSDVTPYTGDYYIRTDAAEGGWDNYKQDSHKFTYFSPYKDALYDYYWVINKKMPNEGDKLNIKGCVGNDINENLANMIESSNYTDGYGDIIPDAGTGVNLRFGYNPETNYFERSILRGSTAGESNFLNLVGNNIYNDKSCNNELNEDNYSAHTDWSKFGDISNWVYEKNVYVKIEGSQQSAQALLKSKAFNGTTIYQLGYEFDNFGRQTGTPAQRDILGSGTTNGTYNIRIIYDFKTNRIVSAWSPVGDVTYSTQTTIEADVLFVRHEDTPVAQVNLDNDAALVSELNSAYFVMEIDGSSDKASESIYWFSVPFDCEISSIFGVEGYVTLDGNGNPTAGTWGIQEYDGETRAQKGWYIEDTQTFWRWKHKSEKLLKGNGYILVFDRTEANNQNLWKEITREEPCEGTDGGCQDGKKTVTTTILRLYFPSSESGWDMTRSDKEQWVEYPDWTCTKPNRKAQDSNWRLLGTNSYSNIKIDAATQFERTEKDSVLDKAPNFVYVYDRTKDVYNRYEPVTSVGKDFLSFNCYMVQFSGKINWNQYTQSEKEGGTPVAARRVVAENELTNAQMTLSLKKGNNTEDNTYIYMDTRATTDFDNQMDLTKITDTRANHIYSVINEVEYAGNTLPVEDQIVPLTVNINANGAYTFAMPEMTDGLEVYLMDNATNAHIDMAIDSYTVDLNKGKIADRFYLDVRVKERTTPTIIETIGTDGNPTGDRFIKVIQNDQLHIIRNGRIYNASGMELNR